MPVADCMRAARERHRTMRLSIVLLGQFLMSPEGQFLVSLDTRSMSSILIVRPGETYRRNLLSASRRQEGSVTILRG